MPEAFFLQLMRKGKVFMWNESKKIKDSIIPETGNYKTPYSSNSNIFSYYFPI